MLYDGVYEQIVNTKIKKELDALDPNQYDIRLDKLDSYEARKVLAIYLSLVIQQGLQYIRDDYPTSKDKEALVEQIKLCNDIVK